jgi:hypothetical protein
MRGNGSSEKLHTGKMPPGNQEALSAAGAANARKHPQP